MSDKEFLDKTLENISKTREFHHLVLGIVLESLKETGMKRKSDFVLATCEELMQKNSIEDFRNAYKTWLVNE